MNASDFTIQQTVGGYFARDNTYDAESCRSTSDGPTRSSQQAGIADDTFDVAILLCYERYAKNVFGAD